MAENAAGTGQAETQPADGGGVTAGSVLGAALRRLAGRPWLLAPFVVVGALVGVADVLRQHDPVPTTSGPWLADAHVTFHLPLYPGGLARTAVPPESVVGLRPGYLAWELALAGSVLVGTGLAVATVVTWASPRLDRGADGYPPWRPGAGWRLAAYVVALAGLQWCWSAAGALREEFGLLALLVALALSVRLFAAPSLLAHGASFRTAILGSNRLVRGHDWSVLGVLVVLGLAAYALASVPEAGGALSTAFVGPALAVASLVVHRRVVAARSNDTENST